jgi:hypothetical protein
MDSKASTIAAAIKEENRFIERRNTIVHAGYGAVTIVEADIKDALGFFEPFGEAVGDVVSTRLTADS